MKRENINKLIELVNICFYYNGDPLDSTIMEKIDDDGIFEDGFINTKYEGAHYGINVQKGVKVTLNACNYIVDDIQFSYFNQDNGVSPLSIKVFVVDE